MTCRRWALGLGLLLWSCPPVTAQGTGSNTRSVALDSVVGVQDYFDDGNAWKTQLIIDTYGTVEIAPKLQVSIRPVFWRVMTGRWENYLSQASLRYEFHKGSKWRIEGGKFASPVGLGLTENRASLNDGLIWWHRGYYSYLPSYGAGTAPHALISSIYPVGVQVNTSGDHWDARAAIIDRAPTDFFITEGAPRRANGVVGAGISPRQGLRVGAAAAWGRSGNADAADPYTLVNIEGEYAVAYTKISGEWTRDEFRTPDGERYARGLTLQARQTLTPRLYVHSRATAIESPVPTAPAGEWQTRTSWYVDTTVGYYWSPEATFRIGHAAVRRWNAPAVDHQIGLSIVWSRRWW